MNFGGVHPFTKKTDDRTLFFFGACCKFGRHFYTTTAPSCYIPASYCHLLATLQTMSIIVVNLQDNEAVFRIFIALLRFSFDAPSYLLYPKYTQYQTQHFNPWLFCVVWISVPPLGLLVAAYSFIGYYVQKNTQLRLYVYLFIVHSVYRIPCCPHADQNCRNWPHHIKIWAVLAYNNSIPLLRRTRWAEHVARMEYRRVAQSILVGKPEAKKQLQNLGAGEDDIIKMEFERIEWMCGFHYSGSGTGYRTRGGCLVNLRVP